MTIQEIITMARYGELKQVSIGEDDNAVVSYINLGNIELYKRFTLQTDEVIIELGVATDQSSPYQMISDTVYEMPSGFMYIVGAYEENGARIPINEEDDALSINTISWNRIQIPSSSANANISIIYVSSPRLFTSLDLLEQLPLPPQLYEALLHYIGYRAHGSVDGLINEENNTHYQRFERSCNRAKADGLITSDSFESTAKFKKRGFA
ncbi:MAG: hypothetical protein L3I99_05830 [Sulfurimonas sp.]|nr:hypothetical protein [Sulfurimonas sp.]